MSHELMVRIHGRNAAFPPVGRRAQFEREACTSLSVYVCGDDGEVRYHCLVDCGPGVPAEVLGRERPFPRPVDALVLTHLHADHTFGLSALVEGVRRESGVATHRLPIFAPAETLDGLLNGPFSFLKAAVARTPVTPGTPVELWRDGDARLTATFVEVVHFARSCVIVLELSQLGLPSIKVVALFDFNDFHPSGTPEAARGSFAANSLFHDANLLVASANTWHAEHTDGRHTGHISCHRLLDHIANWVPERVLLVHYSGFEDKTPNYEELAASGRRMEPSDGPVSDGEFNRRAHKELAKRGYPDPYSVSLARQGDFVTLSTDIRPDELFLRVEYSDSGKLVARGPVSRSVAHECGVMHTSVIVLPYRTIGDQPPEIAVHRRSKHKRVSPNKRDFAGGHVRNSGPIMDRKNWENAELLDRLSHETATRETQEEVICDPPRTFTLSDLRRIGELGEFVAGLDHPGSGNVEASSVYCVNTGDAKVTMKDTDVTGEHELKLEWLTLDALLEEYRLNPGDFADGAGRVLKRLCDPESGRSLRSELVKKLI